MFYCNECKMVGFFQRSKCLTYTEDVKCSAYSKPLLGAVPTRSGGVVRIKRQQLEAGTQGQDANDWSQENRDTKSEMLGNSWRKIFQKILSSHTLTLKTKYIIGDIFDENFSRKMKLQQIDISLHACQPGIVLKVCSKKAF